MAATSQGRRLTEQQRLDQQQVRNDFLAEFIALWALLDSTRLDATGPAWVRAVLALIRDHRERSATVATRYYLDFEAAESPSPRARPRIETPRIEMPPGVQRPAPAPGPRRSPPTPESTRTPRRSNTAKAASTPAVSPPSRTAAASSRRDDTATSSPAPRARRVRLDIDQSAFERRPDQRRTRIEIPDIDWTPNDRAAVVSLTVTGPVSQKSKTSRGKPLQAARDESFVEASGAASRHVLTGGRQSLLTLLADDPQAIGWCRVTDGDPCAFCAMLSSRGPVFLSEQSASFPAHDACACTAEPAYSRSAPWPGRAAEFRRLYREATKGTSGKDSINAFRRAYEQQQRDARRENVA